MKILKKRIKTEDQKVDLLQAQNIINKNQNMIDIVEAEIESIVIDKKAQEEEVFHMKDITIKEEQINLGSIISKKEIIIIRIIIISMILEEKGNFVKDN